MSLSWSFDENKISSYPQILSIPNNASKTDVTYTFPTAKMGQFVTLHRNYQELMEFKEVEVIAVL